MSSEQFLKKLHSKCERDYKSRHFWERLGTVKIGADLYLILRCSQCQKCLMEELEFL